MEKTRETIELHSYDHAPKPIKYANTVGKCSIGEGLAERMQKGSNKV